MIWVGWVERLRWGRESIIGFENEIFGYFSKSFFRRVVKIEVCLESV